MKITLTENLKQKPDFKNLGFGKYFTDHMLYMEYVDGKWGEVEIRPFSDIAVNPASVVFHYGQEIFEGMKAYKNTDGKITMFRPRDNILRMNRSAKRLCMAELPVDEVLEGIFELVRIEKDWIPTDPGTSLYIRPTMIANENLPWRAPQQEIHFLCYFKSCRQLLRSRARTHAYLRRRRVQPRGSRRHGRVQMRRQLCGKSACGGSCETERIRAGFVDGREREKVRRRSR